MPLANPLPSNKADQSDRYSNTATDAPSVYMPNYHDLSPCVFHLRQDLLPTPTGALADHPKISKTAHNCTD